MTTRIPLHRVFRPKWHRWIHVMHVGTYGTQNIHGSIGGPIHVCKCRRCRLHPCGMVSQLRQKTFALVVPNKVAGYDHCRLLVFGACRHACTKRERRGRPAKRVETSRITCFCSLRAHASMLLEGTCGRCPTVRRRHLAQAHAAVQTCTKSLQLRVYVCMHVRRESNTRNIHKTA